MKEAPIHGVRTDRQTGFGAAVAAGLGRTVHPWVAVLHSDCVVATRTWLQAMGESLLRLKDRGVRLVHARTDTPTVDHPALRPSRVEDRADDTVVDGDDPLPLVAFMAHRELFSRIGGPPKAYPYAGYENVELYHRMRRHGYHQAVCGASWVRHAGGATIAALPRKARREMEANYDRCVADLNGGRNAS
jgi:GT2 family glycosyltransferase